MMPRSQRQTGNRGRRKGVERMDGSLPIILPGLPSAPKNVGLLLSAWLKLTRRAARPSRPTMGLLELTCITCAVFSAVICSSPFAFRSMNETIDRVHM